MPESGLGRTIRFGAFDFDRRSGELRKAGSRLNLQGQPLRILYLLLEKPGELVTREELRRELWRDESFGDFEHGLNAAVNRLRDTLGDSAETPRFVETLPRRGYRFIASVAAAAATDEPNRARPQTLPGAPDFASAPPQSPPAEPSAAYRPRRPAWQIVVPATLAAVIAGLLTAAMLRQPRAGGSPVRVLLDVAPADAAQDGGIVPSEFIGTRGGSRTAFDWTPDGRSLVFAGQKGESRQLYVRSLASSQAEPLPGTQGAQAPVVSPDGNWVVFYADGSIRKIPLRGGPVEVLESNVDIPDRLAVAADGRVFYGRIAQGIRQIGPSGASDLTRRGDNEISHILPTLLPGDDVLLYTVRRGSWTWGDEDLVAHVLSTGERKVLLHDATDARYIASGHLVFLRRGELLAVPFDRARLEVRGRPVAVLDGIAQALASPWNGGDITGAGQFAVAPNGALAWIPGPLDSYPDRKLISLDRGGRITPLPAPIHPYGQCVRISPDGRYLAVTVMTLTDYSLWMFDMVRETLTKVTPPGEADGGAWTPDSRRMTFGWLSGGRRSLAWIAPDGSVPVQRLLTAAMQVPGSWLPDGRHIIVFHWGDEDTIHPIRMLTIDDGGRATSYQPVDVYPEAYSPDFSPDGRWLAYTSGQSGRSEVYIQPYPGPGPRLQVSTHGGINPVWNRNGNELFFLSDDENEPKNPTHVMSVEVKETPPTLTLGRPEVLFKEYQHVLYGCGPQHCFDVAPDGHHFFAVQLQPPAHATPVTHINLVLNWLDELKDKVPGGVGR
jgi:Tol biopolymer transport system component/DNA-binding winged helix-turn-helix (wHTH) protein